MAKSDFEIDISGTKQLYEAYQNFANQYDNFLTSFIDNVGRRALQYTIENTPVGHYGSIYAMTGGTLRRAWKLSAVHSSGSEYVVVLYGDSTIAPYAIYVEEGHRTVAKSPKTGKQIYFQLPNGEWRAAKNGFVEGKHMSRDAVMKISKGLPSAYARSFNKFLKQIGLE